MKSENTAKWYESRRNDLLALLNEATGLALPEKYAEELRQTVRKCQEDAFEIALVGEFQGGKSTTFNALCDGRDISPRGQGIKTSAAVISAQNIAGDETKNGLSEWAEVSFKTPAAIALGISTILRRPLSSSDAFRELHNDLSDEEFSMAIANDDTFSSLVDLDNPVHRKILLQATDSLWEQWKRDKGSFSDDDLDQLRIATLQLRFYGTPDEKAMEKATVLPIDRFQKMVAFPKDWMVRWVEGGDAPFSLDEIAFVFVHSVLVRIHSENLRRLGCRITDCPGLFANAYDTSVARRTILNADAVWYLINGEKQIGQSDLKIIRTVAAMGLLGKIEMTCNLKGPHEQKIAEIIPATKAALVNAGHSVEVVPYNARLAFLAEQGKLLLHSPALFSALDRSNMAVDAKREGEPTEMWTRMVRRIGTSIEVDDVETVEGLTEDTVSTVRRESRLDEILSRLETDIIPQKAKSILVDRGSARAANALSAYEGVLKSTEDAALSEEAKWRAEVDAARKQLADFVDRANTTIDRSAFAADKAGLSRDMARDIVSLAFDDEFVGNLSEHVSVVLRLIARNFYWTRKSMEKDLMQRLTPIMADDFRDALTNAVGKWKSGAGTNSLSRLHRSLEDVCADIHDLWVDRNLDANGMLNGFKTPTVSTDDILDMCGDFSSGIVERSGIGEIAEDARRGFFTVLWEYIWPQMLIFIGAMISLPLTIVAVIGKEIWDMAKSEEQREQEELEKIQREVAGIVNSVRPEIEKAISNTKFRDSISAPISKELVRSVEKLETTLRKQLDGLKRDFEKERVSGAEKMFGKSVEERKRIAEENKAIRTGTIAPLRERIEGFEKKVSEELVG